jgi:hypothetical protein
VVGCWVSGAFGMITGFNARERGAEMILIGLAVIILGPFVLRIYCEMVIVIFRINESLRDLIDDIRRRS